MDDNNAQTDYTQSGFDKYLQRRVGDDPPTEEVKEINFDLTAVSGSLGDKIQVGGTVLGAEEKAAITQSAVQEASLNINTTVQKVWPVGSVFISTVDTNPHTLMGFGTWETFGAGKVLVGLDPVDTSFDTAGETGGAKTQALITANMPIHSHSATQGQHRHEWRGGTQYVYITGSAITLSSGGADQVSYSGSAAYTDYQTPTISVANTGSGTAHNNLQPYIVVYFWKRVR